MIWLILASVAGSLVAIGLLGWFVYWVVGKFGKHYDGGDELRFYRNPRTGRLIIPADQIVWSEDGT